MKNLYALNNQNELVHIDKANKYEKYICCNCTKELITKKGNINKHHFCHKEQISCNYETYLHKLGKLYFYKIYDLCLKNGEPFLVQYKKKKKCTSCLKNKHEQISCELKDEISYVDITKHFDLINIEKAHNNYIADILLTSSKTKHTLFIEIAVTHKCEKEKINSGIKIIEINIENEKDLYFLGNKKINLKTKNVDFHNFEIKESIGNYFDPKNCNREFNFFYVENDGGVYKKTSTIQSIMNNLNNNNYQYYRILNRFQCPDYQSLLYDNNLKNINIKSCLICRFYTTNNGYYQDSPHFCKKHKCQIMEDNIEEGMFCDKFWRE